MIRLFAMQPICWFLIDAGAYCGKCHRRLNLLVKLFLDVNTVERHGQHNRHDAQQGKTHPVYYLIKASLCLGSVNYEYYIGMIFLTFQNLTKHRHHLCPATNLDGCVCPAL